MHVQQTPNDILHESRTSEAYRADISLGTSFASEEFVQVSTHFQMDPQEQQITYEMLKLRKCVKVDRFNECNGI